MQFHSFRLDYHHFFIFLSFLNCHSQVELSHAYLSGLHVPVSIRKTPYGYFPLFLGGSKEIMVTFAPDHPSDHYSDGVRITLFGQVR